MKDLLSNIEKHEGFSAKPYIDPLVKQDPESKGIPLEDFEIIEKHFDKLKVTFGLGQTVISIEAARAAVNIDIFKEYINPLLKEKPVILKLNDEKRDALYDMTYNMGVNGILGFKRMWLAIENGLLEEAAQEIMDSKYARELPIRAKENADIIRA